MYEITPTPIIKHFKPSIDTQIAPVKLLFTSLCLDWKSTLPKQAVRSPLLSSCPVSLLLNGLSTYLPTIGQGYPRINLIEGTYC